MTKITSSEQTSDTVAHNDLPCCSAVVKDIQKKKTQYHLHIHTETQHKLCASYKAMQCI